MNIFADFCCPACFRQFVSVHDWWPKGAESAASRTLGELFRVRRGTTAELINIARRSVWRASLVWPKVASGWGFGAWCENYKISRGFRENAFPHQHLGEKVCYFYSAAVITASFLNTNK